MSFLPILTVANEQIKIKRTVLICYFVKKTIHISYKPKAFSVFNLYFAKINNAIPNGKSLTSALLTFSKSCQIVFTLPSVEVAR